MCICESTFAYSRSAFAKAHLHKADVHLRKALLHIADVHLRKPHLYKADNASMSGLNMPTTLYAFFAQTCQARTPVVLWEVPDWMVSYVSCETLLTETFVRNVPREMFLPFHVKAALWRYVLYAWLCASVDARWRNLVCACAVMRQHVHELTELGSSVFMSSQGLDLLFSMLASLTMPHVGERGGAQSKEAQSLQNLYKKSR